MCSLWFLLYCGFFLFSVTNGKSNLIRLPLYKQASYKSADDFIKNANYYTKVLQFFYGQGSLDVPIAKIDLNVDYRTGIELGFPKKQRLVVNVDTSFSGLWVPSSSCYLSFSCYNKNYYTKENSIDYINDILDNVGQSRTIEYEMDKSTESNEDSKLIGDLGFDTLTVDEVEISGVHFMEATQMTYDPFNGVISDGVFGLGFPSETLKMAPPFLTIMDRGVLDSSEFSLFVGRKTQSGELLLGGRDTNYFIEDTLRFHPLKSTSEWKIAVDSIEFNGNELCNKTSEALIDTGTALIAAPINGLKTIYKGLKLVYNGQVAKIPCSQRWNMPVLKITINDQVLQLSGYDYVIEIDSENCVLGFIESPKESLWILGNIFLSTVYTVYDTGDMKIGFAKLAAKK